MKSEVLCYSIAFLSLQNHTTEVRPDFPLLSDLLYENPYSGQMWMVFNVHKQYMFAGDAYSAHYATKLDKGSYTLRMQVQYINLTVS